VVNGTYSGSFNVKAWPISDISVESAVGTALLYIPDEDFYGYSSTALPFGGGSMVARNTTRTFEIQGSPGLTVETGNSVPSLPSNYFTNSSFTTILNRAVYIEHSGSMSPNTTNTKLNGTVSLTYTYTPSAVEPVPEISTVTMGGAGGLLLLGIAARSRRRQQQPSDSVPA
jgi:hypothetical protein